MAKLQQIKYNYFGQGRNGPYIPPSDQGGRIVKLVNARVDEKMNGIYKREGANDLTNALASGRPIAAGQTTESASASIPHVFNLLFQADTTTYVYDINTDVLSSLAVDSNNTGTITLETSRPGSVINGVGARSYFVSGTPSVYIPGDTTLYQLGVPVPTAPVANATTRAVATASTTTGYTYAYTLEHKTTGYESDYSLATFLVQIVANNESRADFTYTANHWTNVYRTTDGGNVLYYVGRIDGDTASSATSHDLAYITDANLINQAFGDIVGRRALPPSNASVSVFHNNRMFIADGETLYISEAYNGSEKNLAYFNIDNIKLLDQPITAMFAWQNELLVFTLQQMYVLRGTNVSEYRLTKLSNIGCISNTAIAANGQDLFYISEEGAHVLTRSNALISRPIDDVLQPLLNTANSGQIVASCTWNPYTKQFISCITNDQPQLVGWQDADTAATVAWEDANTASAVTWQDAEVFTGNALSATFAWNPYLEGNVWTEYQFDQTNGSGGLPFFLLHPHATADYGSYQQRHDFLVYYLNGTDETKILRTFEADVGTDDGMNFDAEVIIGPIVPGVQNNNPKFVWGIGFGSTDQVPQGGSTTISYLVNEFNILDGDYTTDLVSVGTQEDLRFAFTTNTMRWFHLRILNTGDSQSKRLLLRDFTAFYRELRYRA